MSRQVDVAIIGAGTAGLTAMARVRRAGRSFVLIDGGELGTTCARVGCMPSKVLIHAADSFHQRLRLSRVGVAGADGLALDGEEALEHVRDLRDIFVDRVLSGSTDVLGDAFIPGQASFLAPNRLRVEDEEVVAGKVIVATGSTPVVPDAWHDFRERVITTDQLFELDELPESVAVVGLGVIGLEMGQALNRLGVAVTGVDRLQTVAGLRDPVAAAVAVELFRKEFPLWLGEAAAVSLDGDRLRVVSGERVTHVACVLASMGRVPNVADLNLEVLGVPLDEHGVPAHDPATMRVGDSNVFLAGDVTGSTAILHEAALEGRIAGHNASQQSVTAFRRQVPLAITFSDPNVAMVGQPLDALDPDGVAVGEVRMGPVGRALIMGSNRGVLRVYADRANGRLLGACMVAPRAEHLAHLLAWSLEQGLTVQQMLQMPFYHPTMEEALQAALRAVADELYVPLQDPAELRPL